MASVRPSEASLSFVFLLINGVGGAEMAVKDSCEL